jgi:hypothetical protein
MVFKPLEQQMHNSISAEQHFNLTIDFKICGRNFPGKNVSINLANGEINMFTLFSIAHAKKDD